MTASLTHATPPLPSHMSRRRLLLSTVAGSSALALGGPLQAQGDMVRIVVGFPPGGSTDMIARLVAPALGKTLGKTVVVENKPGASGTLAIRQVESSAPDSQVFSLYPTTTMMGFVLQNHEPALDKISAIAPMYEQYTIFAINPTVPGMADVKTLQDLVGAAKKRPGEINYTSSGNGSISHLTTEKLCAMAGVKMQHVAYKGAQPALADLLAGHIAMIAMDPTNLSAHLNSPKVRALAVNFPQRVDFLPHVPTVAEAGFKELSAVVAWVNFVGPAGMSADAVAKMNAAMNQAIADPALRQRMLDVFAIPKAGSAKQARDTMASDLAFWKKVIAESSIKAS